MTKKKVTITQEQEKAIKLAVADYGSDALMDNFRAGGIWTGKDLKPLNGMQPSVLARALYVGYKVESDFDTGDWVFDLVDGQVAQVTRVVGSEVWAKWNGQFEQHVHKNELRHATDKEVERFMEGVKDTKK